MNEIKANRLFFPVIFILSILIFQQCTTPSIIVTREQQKGDDCSNQNQYERAIEHYRYSLAAGKKLGTFRNQDMEADLSRKIATSYSFMGKFNNAIDYASKALGIDSIRNNRLEVIEDYRLLGKLHLYKGDFQSGIPYLEHTLVLNKGMESSLKALNKQSVADTYLSLAQVYMVLGKFNQSEIYTLSAIDLCNKSGDKKGIMESKLLLGQIYLNSGRTKESIDLLESSKKQAKELNANTSRQEQSLGNAYTAMADYENALRHKLAALDEAEKSGIIPQIVWTNIGVGDAYGDLGDNESSLKYYENAQKIQADNQMESKALQASNSIRMGVLDPAGQYYSSIKADVATGLVLLRQGEVNYNAGATDKSVSNYNQAIDYFEKSGVNEGIAKANLRLGDIYINNRNYSLARTCLQNSMAHATGDEILWEIWYQFGRIYEQTNMPDSAIQAYKKAVALIEEIRSRFTIEEYKSKYINDKVKVYNRLIQLLLQSGMHEDAFLYAERARARAFLDMIGNRKINIKPTDDKELITREQDLRLQINSLSKIMQSNHIGSNRGVSDKEIEAELVRSRNEYSSLLNQIKLKSSEYASMVSIDPVPLKSLQNKLDEKTALLSYWVGDTYMTIWVITRENIYSKLTATTSNEIEKYISDARVAVKKFSDFRKDTLGNTLTSPSIGSLEQSDNKNARAELNFIYDKLIQPVETYIAAYSNLCIIPHKSLHFLPFQALIMPDGRFMIEKYNLFYAPSASVYTFCLEKEHHPAKQFLAMAIGELGLGDFTDLPGTKMEVKQIQQVYNDITVKYEGESTETFAKNNATLYKYIHFATHGMLDAQQPLYSYLLFAPTETDDGFLTVNEIFGLNLNASLVTLSACQTGLGDLSNGDELIGLSRAFLYAGTPSVIVSLWSVTDMPTALLMKSFYQNLELHSPQEALSMAQREIMKQYPAPFYWAPFQLIGRGN